MMHFPKSTNEPESITRWKSENDAFVEDPDRSTRGKFEKLKRDTDLQKILLNEQGHLCAYCNRAISDVSSSDESYLVVDHLLPLKDGPLDYHNLVASCKGGAVLGQSIPPANKHCDAKKKNNTLHIDLRPTLPGCEKVLRFEDDGHVVAVGKDRKLLKQQINDFLNLNEAGLVMKREAVLREVIDQIAKAQVSKDELIEDYLAIESRLSENGTQPSRHLRAFAGVVLNYLRNP